MNLHANPIRKVVTMLQKIEAKVKEFAAEKVIEPIEAKLAAGKVLAAPFISSVKESSAPYVAKVSEAKAKLAPRKALR